MAVFVETAEGFDSANDAVGGGSDAFGLFDDVTKGVLGSCFASLEEPEGVGVAVDGQPVAEFEAGGEIGCTPPVKEGLFDGVAFRVMADGAASRVAAEVDVFCFGRRAVGVLLWPSGRSDWRSWAEGCGLIGSLSGSRVEFFHGRLRLNHDSFDRLRNARRERLAGSVHHGIWFLSYGLWDLRLLGEGGGLRLDGVARFGFAPFDFAQDRRQDGYGPDGSMGVGKACQVTDVASGVGEGIAGPGFAASAGPVADCVSHKRRAL
ncbi:MAG TPA: hypothetical protein VKS44_17530 [Candidatus Acidoferrales bacterium]|nr:hypothetical protein [Candidatus Acidoferrales bacterium]